MPSTRYDGRLLVYLVITVIPLISLSLVSVALCVALTMLVLGYGVRLGLVRGPTHRCAHDGYVARGGGLAIFGSVALVMSAAFAFGLLGAELYFPLVGFGFVVALLGVADDLRPLSVSVRLGVQFVVVGLALLWLSAPLLESTPAVLRWLVLGLMLFAGVWWLNLFNFMDGIDGIATVEALSVCAGLLVLCLLSSEQVLPLTVALAIYSCALLGFLLFNWSPARLFLGDGGSLFLGYSLGVLLLLAVSYQILSLWSAAIVIALFVVDATVTLLDRFMRGERLHEAHDTHLYQLLARFFATKVRIDRDVRAESHRWVCLLLLVLNVAWLFPLAYLASTYSNLALELLLLAYAPLLVGGIYLRYQLLARDRVEEVPVALVDADGDL